MIEIMPDFPGNIVAASASGQVSGEDLQDVLRAEVMNRREKHGTIRLFYYFTPDFRRFTTTAAWDDETVGLHHLDAFERTGIVADIAWLGRLAESLASARPDAVRYFNIENLALATEWICSE